MERKEIERRFKFVPNKEFKQLILTPGVDATRKLVDVTIFGKDPNYSIKTMRIRHCGNDEFVISKKIGKGIERDEEEKTIDVKTYELIMKVFSPFITASTTMVTYKVGGYDVKYVSGVWFIEREFDTVENATNSFPSMEECVMHYAEEGNCCNADDVDLATYLRDSARCEE